MKLHSASISTEPPATSPEPSHAEMPDQHPCETLQLLSRRGMRICAWILGAILMLFYTKWLWYLYFSAMRAWPDLPGH